MLELSEGKSSRGESDLSDPGPEISVGELLEDYPRFDPGPFRAEVEEVELLDGGRRADILHTIDDLTGRGYEDWMSADRKEAGIEVDWETLKQDAPEKVVDELREKYRKPPGLYRLRLDPEDEVNWHPGDFFSLKLPETPELDSTGHRLPEIRKDTADEDTVYRAYSVASSPNSDTVELYIKRIPNEEAGRSSLTPVLGAKLEETDEVLLRGPYSDELSMNEMSDNDQVYAATGTGMAPLKSMIDFTMEEELDADRDIWVVLGAPYRDELPADGHLKKLSRENDNFHYVRTLSREGNIADWSGESSYVQEVLRDLHGEEMGLENVEMYVCGGGNMARGVRGMLDDLDVEPVDYQEEVF